MKRLLLAALLAAAPAAGAPARPETVEAAIAEGYAPRPEDEPAGSVLGGLLALGPGLLVHGAGHYYVGERGTALKLLIAELAGIALVVAGQLIDHYTNEAGALGATSQALTHAGVVLFVGSWGADVLGAFKGADPFEPDTTRLDDFTLGIAYRYTADPLTPFSHHLVLHLDADFGWLYARPLVDVEGDFGYRRAELDVGARLFRGRNPRNHLAVGFRGAREEIPEYGLASWGGAGYLGFKVDLGLALRSLRNFYVVNRSGYGVQAYQFRSRTDSVPSFFDDVALTDTYLLLESGVAVNSGRNTHLFLLYVQDPTRDVRPFSRSGGLVEAGLVQRYSEDLDIDLRFTAGESWALWLGLGYVL